MPEETVAPVSVNIDAILRQAASAVRVCCWRGFQEVGATIWAQLDDDTQISITMSKFWEDHTRFHAHGIMRKETRVNNVIKIYRFDILREDFKRWFEMFGINETAVPNPILDACQFECANVFALGETIAKTYGLPKSSVFIGN